MTDKVQKEVDQARELLAAIVDLCKGYPTSVATFAMMQAAAVSIVSTENKLAIADAPRTLHHLIDVCVAAWKRIPKND